MNTDTAKRDELRVKIEASERRIAERTLAEQAQEAAKAATDYTRANPLKVIGGAVVVGIAIGLLTSPGRRVATTAASSAANAVGDAATGAAKTVSNGAGKIVRSRANALWTLAADALVSYAIKLIDEALDGTRAGQDALEDIGDSASAKARSLRRDAGYVAGSAIDRAQAATRKTRRRAERVVRDLTDQVRN